MYSPQINKLAIFILFSISYLYFANGQRSNLIEPVDKINIIKWCVIGVPEFVKCRNFSEAVYRDRNLFYPYYHNISCVKEFSKYNCMKVIEEEKADLTTLNAGEVFRAGRYYSLVPILQESYKDTSNSYYSVAVLKKGTLPGVTNLWHLRGKKACFAGVESLAGWTIPIVKLMESGGLEVVDCNNQVKNAVNYFGPSCAVNSLLDKYNPIGDNSDKLCKLCIGEGPGGKCTNADPYAGFSGAFRCLHEAGEIAFVKHSTVLDLTSDKYNFPSIKKDDFELLCLDGTRKPIDDYAHCNWGPVPSNAVVTSSAKDSKTRTVYQKFLELAFQRYGPNPNNNMSGNGGRFNSTSTPYGFGNRGSTQDDPYGRNYGRDDPNFWDRERSSSKPYNEEENEERNRDYPGGQGDRNRDYPGGQGDRNRDYPGGQGDRNRDYPGGQGDRNRDFFGNQGDRNNDETQHYEGFHLIESVPRYGLVHDLIFLDSTVNLSPISEGGQTFKDYLGQQFTFILKLRNCPVKAVTLCVTSEPEMEKCLKMRTALKAQLLEPELVCFKGYSHTNCMQSIRNGDADISVFDAGDIYTAGLHYRLVPIMAEIYNLGVPEYYAVAVSKEEDPSTEITYLRGKNTCHGGVNTGAGWVVPMAFLISNGWIRSYGCDAMKAAAEYFSKLCLPGSQSTEYNTGVPYDNMCQLCHGTSFSYCHRDASEDYYGHTGAFRCLVEGGGDVAFVKHTTVLENTDGKRKEWWARNTLNEDFQLLCPDGTRALLDDYRRCNLGRVKANAIVTRGGDAYNITQINAYINLFTYAQQFYGRKDQDDFNFAMFYSRPPYSDLIFQDATTQLSVIPPRLRWYSDYLGKDFMRAKRLVDCHAGAPLTIPSLLLILITAVALLTK